VRHDPEAGNELDCLRKVPTLLLRCNPESHPCDQNLDLRVNGSFAVRLAIHPGARIGTVAKLFDGELQEVSRTKPAFFVVLLPSLALADEGEVLIESENAENLAFELQDRLFDRSMIPSRASDILWAISTPSVHQRPLRLRQLPLGATRVGLNPPAADRSRPR